MRRVILLTCALCVAIATVGCASSDGGSNEVEGVISEVTGDLANVESFVVLDDEGDSHLFTPEPGLLFYGGPLSHLRDHIVSGERVVVTFDTAAYGGMTATLILHADGDTSHEPGTDHDHDESDGSDHEDHDMSTTTTG